MSERITTDSLNTCALLKSPVVEIAPCTPPSRTPTPVLSRDASPEQSPLLSPHFKFEGLLLDFPDGTQWQLLESLSNVKLQQVDAPCEATQVFRCIRLDEFGSCVSEAVAKIKFQVRASDHTIYTYKSWLREEEESLGRHPKNPAEVKREIKKTRWLLNACTQPVNNPNQDTDDEAAALERFGDLACEHAPALLDFAIDEVQPGTHEEEIPGGFLVYTLMTKLPGKHIKYHEFWRRPLEERDEIRAAFKRALLAVWKCRIGPRDCAMRNILWDEEQRKCYIVDFEDCAIADGGVKPPPWDDGQFEVWNIAENCFRGWN